MDITKIYLIGCAISLVLIIFCCIVQRKNPPERYFIFYFLVFIVLSYLGAICILGSIVYDSIDIDSIQNWWSKSLWTTKNSKNHE